MLRVMLLFGTRPEAIKMIPLIEEARRRADQIDLTICISAQHKEMLFQVLELFQISPDIDLDVMQPGQTLFDVTARVLTGLKEKAFDTVKPDWLIVQGDTTTTMSGALGAFYGDVKIGHVEAGLRTGDRYSPFPEEVNRRICTLVAHQHWAPTESAKSNLLREAVPEADVFVTGNTAIDTLRHVSERYSATAIRAHISEHQPGLHAALQAADAHRLIVVTMHRRESFGSPIREVCRALREIVRRHPDVALIYPVHLNPNVRGVVHDLLSEEERIHLVEPADYLSFVGLMQAAAIIITDSGGVQEEAPYFGKPVLVLRDVTERMEAVEYGTARLVGRDYEAITGQAHLLLTDDDEYAKMSNAVNPYGDGHAARRIFDALLGLPVDEFAVSSK